jgi:hypothetical protein
MVKLTVRVISWSSLLKSGMFLYTIPQVILPCKSKDYNNYFNFGKCDAILDSKTHLKAKDVPLIAIKNSIRLMVQIRMLQDIGFYHLVPLN